MNYNQTLLFSLIFPLIFSISCSNRDVKEKKEISVQLENANLTFYKDKSLNDRTNVPLIPYITFDFLIQKSDSDTTIMVIGGKDENFLATYNGRKVYFKKQTHILDRQGPHSIWAKLDYLKTFPSDTFSTKSARMEFANDLVTGMKFIYLGPDTIVVKKNDQYLKYLSEADSNLIIN